jgi:acylphosphatase
VAVVTGPEQQAVRSRVVVTGRVQGVFFRDTCRREAAQRGVAGWVRNRADGAVEAVFEGPPAGVAAMVAWAAEGTPQSVVDDVQASDEPPEGIEGFAVR